MSAPEGSPSRLLAARDSGISGLVCGVAFGVASPLAAHPLDTLKTRMQASPSCARGGALATLRQTIKEGGVLSLWRGLLPPLIGSVFYRSCQFGAYTFTHSYLMDEPWARAPIPWTAGLETRVLVSGAIATTARAVIETPLELLKVRAQLGAAWPHARELYTGFSLTWSRLYIALGTFFVICDTADRHAPSLFSTPVVGPFLKGGVAATVGWVLAWPLETLKSLRQSGTDSRGALASLRFILESRGLRGLYRGIGPGLARSVIGNGAALLAFDTCKSCLA
jgi:solute carrier family 25 carnitine/acylcarnitine transporter 20/29